MRKIDRLKTAFARAKDSQHEIDLPLEIKQQPRYRLAAAIFFELKKIQGKESIWLSYKDARRLLNFASSAEVELCYSTLIELGVIRKLEPSGVVGKKKLATTYLFIYKQTPKPKPAEPELKTEPDRNIFAEFKITLFK